MIEFEGTWHINEMEMWDEDYLNLDVQAYIQINSDGTGNFQFGLVSVDIDGKIVEYKDEKRFEFSWQGFDECDPANGCGWLKSSKNDKDVINGEFRFFEGDDSTFIAHKVTH